jgi:uncharacterized lipoprotein
MKKLFVALLCCTLAACGGNTDRNPEEVSADSIEARRDSILVNSPAVVEPPADTAAYDMPVERPDSGASDMPVVNPVNPDVQPR